MKSQQFVTAGILLLAMHAAIHASPAMADSDSRFIFKIPDFNQTDVAGAASNDGHISGPVAVSNSLQWLMPRSNPQLKMINTLASEKYMNIPPRKGRGTSSFLKGVDRYVSDLIGGYKRLHYQGWQFHPKRYTTWTDKPHLDWIIGGVKPNATVWLNVGWYQLDSETKTFYRYGEHWVTVVGYDFDNDKEEKSLIIHDPAPRAGQLFSNNYVGLRQIREGAMVRDARDLKFPAEGFLVLDKGMHMDDSADVAIIDGAVILEL